MTDSYIRKYSPNKWHIISCILILIAVILFIYGAYRAVRIMNPKRIDKYTVLSEGDCVMGSPDVLYGNSNDTENTMSICWTSVGIDGLDPNAAMDGYIISAAGKLRPFFAEKDSEVWDWIDYGGNFRAEKGCTFTGIVTDKYSDGFFSYIDNYISRWDNIGNTYQTPINTENCSELGIVAVDPVAEKTAWIWGIPFLIAGAIILVKAGKLYWYAPENLYNNIDEVK